MSKARYQILGISPGQTLWEISNPVFARTYPTKRCQSSLEKEMLAFREKFEFLKKITFSKYDLSSYILHVPGDFLHFNPLWPHLLLELYNNSSYVIFFCLPKFVQSGSYT